MTAFHLRKADNQELKKRRVCRQPSLASCKNHESWRKSYYTQLHLWWMLYQESPLEPKTSRTHKTYRNWKNTYLFVPPGVLDAKVSNDDQREISVFAFPTTGITQIKRLCWNILLPHTSLSRRTRCQIIGCAQWSRCWPGATEQVRTASFT